MDRKNNCNHNHRTSHGNGFLLGVIVGVLVALLFTTKKGREIFKEWTDKGLDKFSDLQKAVNEKVEEFDEEMEEELVELVEDGGGDYVPELDANESGIMSQESGVDAEESKATAEALNEQIKEKPEPKVYTPAEASKSMLVAKVKVENKKKTGLHETVKNVPPSKRFFLRRVKK